MSRLYVDIVGRAYDRREISVRQVAVGLVKQKYAVVPVYPGSRRPMCTLTARDRKRADREASEEAGREVRHRCGVHHALIDAARTRRVFDRLEKEYAGQQLNLGIVARPSELITIDADTPEERQAFLEWAAKLSGDGSWLERETWHTESPGEQTEDGVWRHHGGGHLYFDAAGLELPAYPEHFKGEGGFEVRWGMSQTLVPPSARAEGRYRGYSDVPDTPEWLLTAIRGRQHQFDEYRSRPHLRDDSIAAWSVHHPWPDLLLEYGWVDSCKADACGCPIFTRPGDPEHWKSATAHEPDCTLEAWEQIEGHAPLHAWSTDLPDELASLGKQTITKLEFVAAMRFGGDVGLAKSELGLVVDDSEWLDSVPTITTTTTEAEPSAVEEWTDIRDDIASRYGITSRGDREVLKKELNRQRRIEAAREIMAYEVGTQSVDDWSSRADILSEVLAQVQAGVVDNTPGVLVRTDGAELFRKGFLHTLWGQSESGKSWLTHLIIKQIIEAGGRACYYDFEDTADTFLSRMVQIGTRDLADHIASGRLGYCNPSTEPSAVAFSQLEQYDVVIVDSISEVISALRDPTMTGTTVRRVMRLFRDLATLGAAVIVIAHQTEKGPADSPMGPSEFRAAVTGQEIKLVNVVPLSPEGGGQSLIYVSKDRKGNSSADVHVDSTKTKSERRLWGELTLEQGDVVDGVLRNDITLISVAPTKHAVKATKADKAEIAVVQYFDDNPDPATINTLHAEIETDLQVSNRVLRRVVEKLIKERVLHACQLSPPSPLGGKPSVMVAMGVAEDCPFKDQHEVSDGSPEP